MFAIFQKELNAFFSSLMAYVIIGFFLILMSLWMWIFPETNVMDADYADLQPLFRLGPYVLMFLVPAITMRLLAEERKMGTLEVLLTSLAYPNPDLSWVSTWPAWSSSWRPCYLTSIYYFSIYQLASPTGNIDTAAILGSYMGLLLLAAVFAAIGLGASALTESQLIAFLLGVFTMLFVVPRI